MAIETRTLGEICDEVGGAIRTGPFGSQLHESDYQEVGLPVVMPKDIVDGKVSTSTIAHIGGEMEERLSHHKLHRGDIVYGRRGDIGRRALIGDREDGWLCGTGCIRVSLGDSVLDPVFLYYYLGDSRVIGWVANQAIGATLPNLNAGIIRSIPVSYPPLPTQRKIAAILSAYDDLIENNTRRIRILEEMAQALYREWFVRFRFPGHEGVRMVETAVGLAPEGWEVRPVGQTLSYTINGGWGEEVPTDECQIEAFVIRGTDIPNARQGSVGKCPLRFHKQSNFSARRLQPGDIVMEVSGGSKGQPVGRALLVNSRLLEALDGRAICASFCKLLRLDRSILLPELLYLHLLEIYEDRRIEKYQTQSTGIINLKSTYFLEKELVLIPGTDYQCEFAKIVAPMLQLAQTLGTKNANLRRTRDLLLPKLVAGEADVSELEIRA